MRPLLVLPMLLFAGCLGIGSGDVEACPSPNVATLFPPGGADGEMVARAPGEPAPTLYWARNVLDANATLTARTWTDPEREAAWAAPDDTPEVTHALAPVALAFGALEASPADDAADVSVELRIASAEAACAPLGVVEGYALAPPEEAPRAAAGMGVHVRTAGFWENGTSFYTNHGGVHARDDIPKGYLGEYGGDEPLKVYVYDQDPSEMPRRYQEAGYAVTIRGFNEALKNIPQGGARVALLAPQDAYTAPGREEHPLYGDALVFWIEAVEVVDLPCPLPQPQCDVPATPPLPPIPPVPPTR